MNALLEILTGAGLLSDAYACRRTYRVSFGGPRTDAENIRSDYEKVGADMKSALASPYVQSTYRNRASLEGR